MDWIARIDPEDLEVFLQEADEQLQLLDEDIVSLERDPSNPDILQEIFRASHTLKGSSGMLGHQRMAEMAHVMENVLDRLRKGSLVVTPQVTDALLTSLDGLKLLKNELLTREESGVDIAATVAVLERLGEELPSPSTARPDGRGESALSPGPEAVQRLQALLMEGHSAFRVGVALREGTMWAAVRCFQVLTEMSGMGEVLCSVPSQAEIDAERAGSRLELVVATALGEDALRRAAAAVEDVERVEVTPYLSRGMPETPDGAPAGNGSAPHKTNQQSQTVRVDVERLDHLMDTIGELVVERTRITQICRLLESRSKEDELVQALGKTSADIVKVVDDLRDSAMKIRMLPVGTVFNGFPRMVRDLARKAGKKVELVVEGQETEIDRTVIERIRDPLVHLMRNAVDHGIEPSERRLAVGKKETGLIRLSASHEQGHIVIAVEDDGRGIDPRLIRDASVKKGLITAEAASRLSDAECVDLIFMPGASTAERPTQVSGRGVGMDIVRTNLESINGYVTLDSRVGEGTRFNLRLPLTLATLQALLVSLGQAVYAIPLVHVLETIRLAPGDVYTVGGKEVIRLRESVLPLLRLSAALGLEEAGATGSDWAFAIVVQSGEKLVALAVGALMEAQEIVVKSLGRYIGDVRGIAGASILGDGRVVLILDIPTLVNAARSRVAQGQVTSLRDRPESVVGGSTQGRRGIPQRAMGDTSTRNAS